MSFGAMVINTFGVTLNINQVQALGGEKAVEKIAKGLGVEIHRLNNCNDDITGILVGNFCRKEKGDPEELSEEVVAKLCPALGVNEDDCGFYEDVIIYG